MNVFFFRIPNEVAKIIVKDLGVKKCFNLSRKFKYTGEEFENVEVIDFDYKVGFETVYDNKDLLKSPPIDAEFLKEFAEVESQYMLMEERIGRNTGTFWDGTSVPFDERVYDLEFNKYQYSTVRKTYLERKFDYLKNLKFWINFLNENQIDVMFTPPIPHMPFSYVLHKVLEKKNIPLIFLCHLSVPNYTIPSMDMVEDLKSFKDEYEQFKLGLKGDEALNEDFKTEYNRICKAEGNDFVPHYEKSQNISKAKRNSIKFKLANKSKNLANALKKDTSKLFSIDYHYFKYKHKKTSKNRSKFIESLKVTPDLNANFFYYPLHRQPEANTNPMGTVYADQLINVDMVAKLLPDNYVLYVKEHPQQDQVTRDFNFYKQISEGYPNVKFIDSSVSSQELVEKAKAIVTVTGTAAWEGFGKSKPALMFGNHYNAMFEGAFKINSVSDCRKAITEICDNNFQPNLEQLKVFMLYLQSVSYKGTEYPHNFDADENFANMSKAFIDKYKSLV